MPDLEQLAWGVCLLAALGWTYLMGHSAGWVAGRRAAARYAEKACPPHCIRDDGMCLWCDTPVAWPATARPRR